MRLLFVLFISLNFVSATNGQELAGEYQGTYPVRESYVEVNGVDLYYRLIGDGPPLLLIHGFIATGNLWSSLVDDLADRNTLIVPDLPAHGRSSSHGGPYLYPQVAQDILALLDYLQITEFDAIGHSAGGSILLHIATQYPSRVKAMILVSSGHRYSAEIRKNIAQWPDLEDSLPLVQEYLRNSHPGGDEQIRSLITALRSLSNYNGNVEFTADRLNEIRARTLLIVGDSDEWFPVEVILEMRDAIPGSSMWVIPSQGHSPIWPDWGGSTDARTIFPSTVDVFLHGSE